MDRRDFLSTVAGASVMLMSGAARAAVPEAEPVEPAAMPERANRGMALRSRVEHISGIPLGGIGAGSVEIRPNGELDDWLIFNNGGLSPQQAGGDGGWSDPSFGSNSLQFFLHARTAGGAPVLRRLTVSAGQQNGDSLYSLSWAKPVEEIQYDGRYPLAKLDYLDDELPLTVSGLFLSPIVPHDVRTAGTPGFHARFTVKNTGKKRVTASIAAHLANPLARGQDGSLRSAESRRLTNTITRAGDTTYLTMRTASRIRQKATVGSLGLSVTGGTPSWIAADFGDYFTAGGFGTRPRSFLEPFRQAGRLPNLGEGDCPAKLLPAEFDPAALSDSERQNLLRDLSRYASLKAAIDSAVEVDPAYLTSRSEEMLRILHSRMENLAGRERKAEWWGEAALCSTVDLAPGEEKTLHFTLGWFFPHHMSGKGPEMGHIYEKWFKDAEEVNRSLVDHADEHLRKVQAFADAIAGTSLGPEIAFCWTGQLTTLVKSSWWTRDDQFAIWEGLGCCGLHTTDITYQGSFPIIALFPELQQKQMRMGAAKQQENGRVPHFFHTDLDTVDNGWNRVDMNPQFVMLICRDWLWTGDDDYLKALWPHVVKAMEFTGSLDTDGDGLPDKDTSVNTYDQWALRGTPAYIANLWLGGLLAGIRMARAMGDKDREAAWTSLLERGSVAFERKLWNGEYYALWSDGAVRDECCMSDQLSGVWFTNLMGIGHALPRDRVEAALKAVVKHNYDREHGLANATYPAGRVKHYPAFGNGQATANWTGIEYAMASMLIDFGMGKEGMALISAVDDRYRRAGRCWNHVECGDHYYRAMSSWATLLAATGFKPDVPARSLTFAPAIRQKTLRAPWFSATAWGTLRATANERELACMSGTMELQTLRVNLDGNHARVTLNGGQQAATVERKNGLLVVTLEKPVTLGAGSALKVTA